LKSFSFLQKRAKALFPRENGLFFSYGADFIPLCRGGDVSFFFPKKKKLQKEVGELAVRSPRQSTVPQGLILSRRYGAFREIAPVPESKALGFLTAAPILQI